MKSDTVILQMKQFGSLVIFLFLYMISYSQVPDFESFDRAEMARQKEALHRSIQLGENSKTSNQDNYDVTYYFLDLTPNPASSILHGKVQIVAEVLSQTLNHMELNFWDGMDIIDIHHRSSPQTQLSYLHENNILDVDLGGNYSAGEIIDILVAYEGRPQNVGYGLSGHSSFGFDTYNGSPMIWTLSEPFGARTWWPCKDVPSDKADSVDIKVTVPNNLIVGSNGSLKSIQTSGESTTYWWQERYPIVTYLVSLAIHPYTLYSDWYVYGDNDSMEVQFYVFPDHFEAVQENYGKTVDMIRFFSDIFGQYPFIEEKYGHAEFLFGGAMEHQTLTSLGGWWESLIAHELAHQWWGDMITCRSFHHIWLNEGFASYSEALWYEYAYPPMTASDYQMNYRYLGPGTIYVEDPQNDPIFHGGLSYNKGSWVLHMLRGAVGDSNFFNILRTYYNSPQHHHGTATTEEFQAICQQISGLNLEKFFQQWIYSEYYPVYRYGWQYRELNPGYETKLVIEQKQENTGLFWMPVDVRVLTTAGEENFVVWDSLQSQTFYLNTQHAPLKVELDPNNWILKESQEMKLHPVALTTGLNHPYQLPGIDSLAIFSTIKNPDNHQLEVEAIIEDTSGTHLDTVTLGDHGLHPDSMAGDNIYSGLWPVPAGEQYYTLHIHTYSFHSGFMSPVYHASQFTTVGPVVLENFTYFGSDSIPNAGDLIRLKLNLKNASSAVTVTQISAYISSPDTHVTFVTPINPEYGDINPGEKATTLGLYNIKLESNCPAGYRIPFNIDIYNEGQLFWKDNFSLIIEPAVSIAGEDNLKPNSFTLYQNYPNPFNPLTTIAFELPETAQASLKVFNLLGEEVATLASGRLSAGSHSFIWKPEDKSASGVYLYRLTAGEHVQVRKMILMR